MSINPKKLILPTYLGPENQGDLNVGYISVGFDRNYAFDNNFRRSEVKAYLERFTKALLQKLGAYETTDIQTSLDDTSVYVHYPTFLKKNGGKDYGAMREFQEKFFSTLESAFHELGSVPEHGQDGNEIGGSHAERAKASKLQGSRQQG